MNVNALNQSVMTQYQQRLKRKAETSEVNLQVNNSSSGYATIQQDDFASRIWNMTDSMPRENQISFTATVLANRISALNSCSVDVIWVGKTGCHIHKITDSNIC